MIAASLECIVYYKRRLTLRHTPMRRRVPACHGFICLEDPVMRRLVVLTLLSAMSVCAFAASDPAIEAKNGMVVSSQHFASQIGVDILKAGGNAVDAAVAVGYAQAVTNPCCGNIGGGGFMTVHLADGRDRFINFRETAPAAASANMYLDAKGNVIPDDSRATASC
jgi:gamma-glutamyltranspeptidase / glutathione hydrolase